MSIQDAITAAYLAGGANSALDQSYAIYDAIEFKPGQVYIPELEEIHQAMTRLELADQFYEQV